MQDLHVTETLPQMVALSEAYVQIYEQHEWGMQTVNGDHHLAFPSPSFFPLTTDNISQANLYVSIDF
jgi:hypothetical protein